MVGHYTLPLEDIGIAAKTFGSLSSLFELGATVSHQNVLCKFCVPVSPEQDQIILSKVAKTSELSSVLHQVQ